MNKKGFSLVELLTVIVIIGLLSSVAVISYTYFINIGKEKVYETYMDTMHAEAVIYYLKNPNAITTFPQTLYLADLDTEPIKNPDDKNDLCNSNDTYVLVERGSNTNMISLKYTVYLKCNNYSGEKEYID